MRPDPERPDPAALAQARAVVAEVLGIGARVDHAHVLQAGPPSRVLDLRLGGPPHRLVLKLVPVAEQPGRDLERTAAAADLARRAGVPVPEVLGADGSGRLGGWQYLLQRHVDAPTWHQVRPGLSEDELAGVHGRIATLLLALRGLHPDGFGELGELGGTTGADLLAALRRRVDLRVGRPAAHALAMELLDRHGQLLACGPAPSLGHDDLHHHNLLVSPGPQGWRPAAVLDWDKAWAGPPEADLARVAFWDGMTGPGFWAVYRHAVPESDGEAERLALHQLLWCLEYDAPTDRHRADTAALARRFELPPESSEPS